jgi:serine/threonine-protein kinase
MDGGWTGAGRGGVTAEDGFVLGDLRIGEVLGRGATGEVRRAVGPNGELVAVKLLRQELADDSQVVARLLRECSVVARLADRHVIRIRHLIAQDDRVGIVMDYLPGGDLRGLLRRRGTLTPTDAARLTSQVLLALRRAHDAGVVHRDVKPENVLLDGDDAVLTDFGIARQLEGPALTTGTGILGTPSYLAPELASQRPTTPAVDVYSTGCLFYELLAGRPPFVGGPALAVLLRHVNETPARPADLPDRVWDLLAAMLAKEPAERPTADQAITALADLAPTLARLPALTPLAGPPSTSGVATQVSVPTWSLTPDWDRNLTTHVPTAGDADGAHPTQLNRFLADDAMAETQIGLTGSRDGLPAQGSGWEPSDSASPVAGRGAAPGATRRSGSTRGHGSAGGPGSGGGFGSGGGSGSGGGIGSVGGIGSARPGGADRRGPGTSRRGLIVLVAAVVVLLLAGTALAVALRAAGHNDATSSSDPGSATTLDATPEANATLPAGGASTDIASGPATSTRATTPPTETTTATGPTSGTAPAQPVLRATARSGAVSLAITQPDGGQVTSYQITATGLATRTVAAAKSTVVIEVPDCTSRSFTATAVGPGGSTASAPVDAVGCVAPGAVRNVLQTTPSAGTRRLTWDPPADLGGDSQVDYRLAVTGTGSTTTVSTVSATSFVLTCSTDGTDCAEGTTVLIEARNSVGPGPRVRVPIQGASASPAPPAG